MVFRQVFPAIQGMSAVATATTTPRPSGPGCEKGGGGKGGAVSILEEAEA